MKYHSQYIKLFYRYLSEKISPLIIKYNITANAISVSRIFLITISGLLLFSESYFFKLISVLFLFLFSFFDALDGSIAFKTKKSNLGLWVDPLFDRLGLLIFFSCLSLLFLKNENYFLALLPYLNLFFYIQRSLIGSDIRTKDKFINFRKFFSNKTTDEKTVHTIQDIKNNKFNFRGIVSFLFHQFSPHTHNQIIYLIIFILLNQISFGIIFLLLLNFSWYLYEAYKVTKISINLDKKNLNE